MLSLCAKALALCAVPAQPPASPGPRPRAHRPRCVSPAPRSGALSLSSAFLPTVPPPPASARTDLACRTVRLTLCAISPALMNSHRSAPRFQGPQRNACQLAGAASLPPPALSLSGAVLEPSGFPSAPPSSLLHASIPGVHYFQVTAPPPPRSSIPPCAPGALPGPPSGQRPLPPARRHRWLFPFPSSVGPCSSVLLSKGDFLSGDCAPPGGPHRPQRCRILLGWLDP